MPNFSPRVPKDFSSRVGKPRWMFTIVLCAGFLLLPAYLPSQPSPQQEGPTILKEKVKDLVEQVQERDEKLALRRATIAKQRFMLTSLVLFIALIAASLIVMRSRDSSRRKEMKYELVRSQQQALSLQMNPHFVFNTLGSLQSFILKNDRHNSNLYLTKFSRLLRLILDNLEKETISLEEEIGSLHLYLELQHMRFGDRFDYKIRVDPRIAADSVRVPPFLIQPQVENSIHHGLLPRNSRGNLKVELRVRGQGLLWIVEDDGIGRAAAGKKEARPGDEGRLHGREITQRRIELLNTLTPDQYSFATYDLKNSAGEAAGTRVEISMKNDGL